MAYWLMKSEPDEFGWEDLIARQEAEWDGVRNHQASNNLKQMVVGDQAFFYHSRQGLEIVGIMEIVEKASPDTTDDSGKWVSVRVKPLRPLDNPVSLKKIKSDTLLNTMVVARHSRLSVTPVTPDEWKRILSLASDQK